MKNRFVSEGDAAYLLASEGHCMLLATSENSDIEFSQVMFSVKKSEGSNR